MKFSKEVIERAKKLMEADPEVAKYFVEVGRLTGDELGREILKRLLEE